MYSSTSPYFETKINKNGLGMMTNRSIPKYSDDMSFQITSVYDRRPDLLAYDLYRETDLWWVFAARNPNTLADPLNDFVEGTTIRIPKLDVLKDTLGF